MGGYRGRRFRCLTFRFSGARQRRPRCNGLLGVIVPWRPEYNMGGFLRRNELNAFVSQRRARQSPRTVRSPPPSRNPIWRRRWPQRGSMTTSLAAVPRMLRAILEDVRTDSRFLARHELERLVGDNPPPLSTFQLTSLDLIHARPPIQMEGGHDILLRDGPVSHEALDRQRSTQPTECWPHWLGPNAYPAISSYGPHR